MVQREDFAQLDITAKLVSRRYARMVPTELSLVLMLAHNAQWVTIALLDLVLSRYQLPVQILSIVQLVLELVSIAQLEHTHQQVWTVLKVPINANPVLQASIVKVVRTVLLVIALLEPTVSLDQRSRLMALKLKTKPTIICHVLLVTIAQLVSQYLRHAQRLSSPPKVPQLSPHVMLLVKLEFTVQSDQESNWIAQEVIIVQVELLLQLLVLEEPICQELRQQVRMIARGVWLDSFVIELVSDSQISTIVHLVTTAKVVIPTK